jgi:hypothetical protein
MRFPRAVPEMAQHHGNDVGAFLAKIAATLAVDVLQLEPVLLQLQKAPVNVEQVGRAQMGLVDQFTLGVAQHLFKINRRHWRKPSVPRVQFNGECNW